MYTLMLSSICTAVLFLTATVATALLIHRKVRQRKVAAALRIENAQGIAQEGFTSIGGIDQWISIRGENQNNPVLLMIHGGPGCSYSIFTPHLRPWEQHFTIVQWDQRGAGKTLTRAGSRGCGEISMKQLTRDAIELAEYLRARLHQSRLLLLAGSMGSTFGLQAARQRPDLFFAYIGTDQNVGMVREREAIHQQLLRELRRLGLTRAAKAVERIGADPTLWTPDDFTAIAQWTMKSDPKGYRRTIKMLKDAVWYAPGWKFRDIRAFVKGMRLSLECLLPEIARYDAWAQGTRFELPIFILQGENDVLTPTELARAYFNEISAPLKHLELIPNAGHFAAFLAPEQFLEKLLAHVRPLADAPGMGSCGKAIRMEPITTLRAE